MGTFLLVPLQILIIYIIVSFVWSGLEYLIYGERHPRLVDDIVGIILVISIWFNIFG